MAVYTQLEFDEIAALVAPLGLGRLISAQGIAAGVENTTYFLDFEREKNSAAGYVLTIAETLSSADLQFAANLMHKLSTRDLPVPSPVFLGPVFNARQAVLSIREKPALLVPRVAGTHPQLATPVLCRQVGKVLAKLHIATRDMGEHHESHRSLSWVEATGKSLLPYLGEAEQKLINAELEALHDFIDAGNALPQAIIHGDLFRDNVLVEHGQITALIDFFSAGTSYVLLDLAIVVNDWCFDDRGQFDSENYLALTRGYCEIRTPEAIEIQRWNQLLRIAALRFWVSRLNEQLMVGAHAPKGRGKDPFPYQHLMLRHRDQQLPLKP